MSIVTRLFLLGSNPALTAAAPHFLAAAGGPGARLALLLQGGPNHQKYLPVYKDPFTGPDASNWQVVIPAEDGRLNLPQVTEILEKADGILIGGGRTQEYRRLYASGPVGELLRARFSAGIPILGISAGTLIAPNICVLFPEDPGTDALRLEPGLGLAGEVLFGVHFSERHALPGLLQAMTASRIPIAWGLDEPCAVVFEDGVFSRVLGRSAYQIRMTNFETRAHTISLFPAGYGCAALGLQGGR